MQVHWLMYRLEMMHIYSSCISLPNILIFMHRLYIDDLHSVHCSNDFIALEYYY